LHLKTDAISSAVWERATHHVRAQRSYLWSISYPTLFDGVQTN